MHSGFGRGRKAGAMSVARAYTGELGDGEGAGWRGNLEHCLSALPPVTTSDFCRRETPEPPVPIYSPNLRGEYFLC